MDYLSESEAESLKTALEAQHFRDATEALGFIDGYLKAVESTRELTAARKVADLVAGNNRGSA